MSSVRSRFVPAIVPDPSAVGGALHFAFHRRRLVVANGNLLDVSPTELGLEVVRSLYLGTRGDVACHAVELAPDADPAPMGLETFDLRRVFVSLGPELFDLAGRAAQILEWDRTHRYCGACGAPTEPSTNERSRRCTTCGQTAFPRLSPAIIVAVERGDEILLARGPAFPPGLYSALAGFVEPGESVEECVAREVHEEVGLEVDDVRYFGSQPWPFPHSLMLGFFARYVSGEIRPQPGEIEDARFVHVDALPSMIPSQFASGMSIASWLIDEFRRRRGRA